MCFPVFVNQRLRWSYRFSGCAKGFVFVCIMVCGGLICSPSRAVVPSEQGDLDRGRLLAKGSASGQMLKLKSTVAQAGVASLLTQLEANTKAAKSYLADDSDLGLYLSPSQVPSAGRVLITRRHANQEAHTSCSGVLVSSEMFLTAGHCVCDVDGVYLPQAKPCRAAFKELSISVFFPTAGLFGVREQPILHEHYRSAEGPIGPGSAEIADLALLRFAEPIPILPAQVGTNFQAGKFTIASYGAFSFSNVSELTHKGFKANVPYQDGAKQLSGVNNVIYEIDGCGQSATKDTFCTVFAGGLPVSRGSQQSTAVCGGDSGAPIYRQDRTSGRLAVLGIASYYWPSEISCDALSVRRSHFLNLDLYSDWIARQIGTTVAVGNDISNCWEGLLGKGEYKLPALLAAGTLSLTVFDFERGESLRPEVTIAGTVQEACKTEATFGITVCSVSSPSDLTLKFGSGLAQTLFCTK